MLPASAGCLPASRAGARSALPTAAAAPAAVALYGMTGDFCAEEVCSLPSILSVASQTSPSEGAPCAVLRSATALEADVPAGGLPSAPTPPVSGSDEDGCPSRLSPIAAPPPPALGASPLLPAAAHAPYFLGMEPGWAASARLLDLSIASAPAAALATLADWLPGLSQAAGALLLHPGLFPAAAPAGLVPAPPSGVGSTSIMTSRILLA